MKYYLLFVLCCVIFNCFHFALTRSTYDENIYDFEHKTAFIVPNIKKTWLAADHYCTQIEMRLYTIITGEDNENLIHMLKEKSIHNVWTGGNNLEGEWKWAINEPMINTNWTGDSPSQNNRCLEYEYNYEAFYWNEAECDKELHFVCEF